MKMIEVFYSSADLGKLDTLAKLAGNKINPVLDNLLFMEDGGVVASDGETSIRTVIEPIEGEAQGFCVEAKLLMEVVKTLPHQPLKFSVGEGNLAITHNSGTFELPVSSPLEYPQVNFDGSDNQVYMASDVLLDVLNKTVYATAVDELRPVMNGVYFDFPNFVATDGMRLVKYSSDITGGDQFILPPKPANLLRSILPKEMGDVCISPSSDSVVFTSLNFAINARLIEGNYPNYNSVIPQNNSIKVEVERTTLMGALRRVGVMTSEDTNLIRLDISNSSMVISGQDIDLSTSAKESIPCVSNGDIEIGFKATLAVEILRNVTSDNIVIELEGASKAALFKPQDESELTILLMPMAF